MTPRSFRWFSIPFAMLVALGCSAQTSSSIPPGSPPPGPGTTPPSTTPPSTAPPPTDACGGAPATSIEGVVMFPNGTLPVVRALVYVPVDPTGAVPVSGTCGECIDRSGVYAVAETGIDGRFTLTGVPAGTNMIVVKKGPFERHVPVMLTACTSNALPPDATRLPRDTTEGAVPRIAVVTGTYDHMQSVLERLGLSVSVIDIVPGDPDDWSAPSSDGGAGFFRDRTRLMGYDYVFVNCGAGFADDWSGPSALREAGIRDNIRAFVEGGGRLYVTDLAYDVVESTLPSALDFGGAGGMSETPEPIDAAENGREIYTPVHAEVMDADLRAWLTQTGALDASGQMEVRGLEDGWVVIQAASPERSKVWVQGPLDAPGGNPTGVRPLTVTSDRGCGRALFTSYHTISESGGGATLSAQEQALAYLVLEIGNCIEEPTLY